MTLFKGASEFNGIYRNQTKEREDAAKSTSGRLFFLDLGAGRILSASRTVLI